LVHELGRDQPNTTKELLDIATQHASSEEAVRAVFIMGNGKMVPSDNRAAPSKGTDKGTKKDAKGGKKGQKQRPRWITIATSGNDDDKEADGSNEEYVAAAECDFKRQAWQPKDHFEKLLEAAYLNLAYPIKHKLKDYTMMKNFMTLGTLSKGSSPRETRVGWVHHPFQGMWQS
jgi:hypothetical protein